MDTNTQRTSETNHTLPVDVLRQRADDLERIGAELIIVNQLNLGIRCWKEAANFRRASGVRVLVPEENLPIMAEEYLKPQWSDLNDLIQMERELDTDEGKLNAVYQAMLVRILHGIDQYDDFWKLLDFDQLSKHSIAYAKYILLLFEWYALYASQDSVKQDYLTPTPPDCAHFTSDVIPFLRLMRKVPELVSNWDDIGDTRSPEDWKQFNCIFQRILEFMMARLKVTSSAHHDIQNRLLNSFVMLHDISLLLWLIFEESDEEWIVEVRVFIRKVVAANCITSMFGRNMLLQTCADFSQFIKNKITNSARLRERRSVQYRKLIKLLIDAGADMNSVDIDGNTCLHLLVCEEKSEIIDRPAVEYFLEKGASHLWDKPNKRGVTPREILNRKQD